jgi:hypothetical protein
MLAPASSQAESMAQNVSEKLTDEMIEMVKKNNGTVTPYVFDKKFVCLDLVTDATNISKSQKYIRALYAKWRAKGAEDCIESEGREKLKGIKVRIGDKSTTAKYAMLKDALQFLPTLGGFKKYLNLMNILRNEDDVHADCVQQIDQSEKSDDDDDDDVKPSDNSGLLLMLASVKKSMEEQKNRMAEQQIKILEIEECIRNSNNEVQSTRVAFKRKHMDDCKYTEASSNALCSMPPRRCKSNGCTSYAKNSDGYCEAHLLIHEISRL